jgi:hypothetical protein
MHGTLHVALQVACRWQAEDAISKHCGEGAPVMVWGSIPILADQAQMHLVGSTDLGDVRAQLEEVGVLCLQQNQQLLYACWRSD